jgi:hypothetical protein
MANSATTIGIGGSKNIIGLTSRVRQASPLPEDTQEVISPQIPYNLDLDTCQRYNMCPQTGSENQFNTEEEGVPDYFFDPVFDDDFSTQIPGEPNVVSTPTPISRPQITPIFRSPAVAPSDSYSKPFIWKK